MQIHELNNYTGDLDANAYLAVDNGSDTGKVSAKNLLLDINEEIDQLGTYLNGRIDNIIAGGDAPSAAEIVDARRSFDGINYASLGEAVRAQAEELFDSIEEHKSAQFSYKDLESPVLANGFYKASDKIYYDNPVIVTKTVNHVPGTSYRYIGHVYGSAGYYGVTYLDANDQVIDGKFISNTTDTWYNEIVTPPYGVSKVAFSTNKNNMNNNVDSYMLVQHIVSAEIKDHKYNGNIGFSPFPALDSAFMHIPIYGQSLSIGADAPFYNDGTMDGLFMLSDITSLNENGGLVPLELTSGFMNPIVPALHDLKKIADENGINHRIITSSSGKGARSIAQLMTQSQQDDIRVERGLGYAINADSPRQFTVWQDNMNKVKNVIYGRFGVNVECPVIVFLQGERDFYTDAELNSSGAEMPNAYACGDNKALYKEYMLRLKNAMQSDVMSRYGQTYKPLFAIYPCSGDFIKTTTMGITMAQQEFARENDDVILLAPQYPVPNYNNGHCSTNGYRWLGEYIGRDLAEFFVNRNKPTQLEAMSGYVIGNRAFIETRGGFMPLVIDDYTVPAKTNKGFKLYVNGAEAAVTNVALHGNAIVLTSSVNMDSASKVEVTYAQNVFTGHGNIRDSLPAKGQYEYLDDTSDTGTGGNLSIVYRPLDKDGNSLIGQRYPLSNWLVPFYLKIVG